MAFCTVVDRYIEPPVMDQVTDTCGKYTYL